MTDLGQHAAQMSIIANYTHPAFDFQQNFQLNFATPYLLTYLIGALLTKLVGVVAATKLLVLIAMLGLPLSAHFLSRADGDRSWYPLLVFPLAFGVSFYSGFLPFLFSLPIALFAQRFARKQRPVESGVLCLAVAITHPMSGLLACAICAAALITSHERHSLKPVIAIIPAAALLIGWGLYAAGSQPDVAGGIHIDRTAPWRFVYLVTHALAWPDDAVAMIASALIFGLVIAGCFGLRRRALLIPAIFTLLCYVLLPEKVFGTSVVYPRFGGMALIQGCAAVNELPRFKGAMRGAIATVAIGWLAVLGIRFYGYAGEAPGLQATIEAMQPGRHIEALVGDSASQAVPALAYLHAPSWYQALKGGTTPQSFGEYFALVALQRSGEAPRPAPGDYRLVRTGGPPAALPAGFVKQAETGNWAAWERRR